MTPYSKGITFPNYTKTFIKYVLRKIWIEYFLTSLNTLMIHADIKQKPATLLSKHDKSLVSI